MKRLCVVRHAKAENGSFGSDELRRLSHRGHCQAEELGEALLSSGLVFDAFFCSAALRTRETYDDLCRAGFLSGASVAYEEELYIISLNAMLYKIATLDEELGSVGFVIHNPVCAELMDYLSSCSVEAVRPCSCSVFEFDVDSWSDVARSNGNMVFNFRPL